MIPSILHWSNSFCHQMQSHYTRCLVLSWNQTHTQNMQQTSHITHHPVKLQKLHSAYVQHPSFPSSCMHTRFLVLSLQWTQTHIIHHTPLRVARQMLSAYNTDLVPHKWHAVLPENIIQHPSHTNKYNNTNCLVISANNKHCMSHNIHLMLSANIITPHYISHTNKGK